MARIKFELPKHFNFSTIIKVRITDLNYGAHLGNDAMVSLMHEARNLFFRSLGYSEMDIAGTSLIMSDLAIQFKAEAFTGDELKFEVTAGDFGMTSFDLYYLISRNSDQKIVATAKTNMVCFDYTNRKMTSVPEEFSRKFIS